MENQWSTRFRYVMFGLLVVAIVAFIWYARVVVKPLVVSALIAYVLNPLVHFLCAKTPLTRRGGVAIVFLLALALLVAAIWLVIPVLVTEFQVLIADLDQLLFNLMELTSKNYIILGQEFSFQEIIPDLTQIFPGNLADITVDAFHIIESTTRNLLWLLVILATAYSLLRDWEKLRDWLFSLAPSSYQADTKRIYQEIKLIWSGYLRGNLALMSVTAVIFTIAWIAIGVPGALVLGLIAGLLTIIPDLGPAIAALLAILVSLVEGSTYLGLSNFWFAILVLGVYLVLINVKNIWIRPRIFGRSVHMHDGIVFVAIIAAVVIEGVLGALIIIPMLASWGVISGYVWRRVLGEEPFPEPLVDHDDLIESTRVEETSV